jgi:hypothetical protein
MSDKLTQELIDNLEDKIAIAKLEGKDAGELEKTLAIVRKKGVSNRKDMSLNEAIKAGLEKPELSTEGFTRPDVPLDSFNIPEKNIYTSPALKEAVKNSSPEFAQINKAVPKSVKLALLAGGAGLAGTAAMVNNFAKPDTQTPEQLADSIKNRDKLTTDSSGIGPSIFEKALEKNPNMEPFKIQKMLMDQGYSLEEMTKPTSLPKTTRIQDMFHYNPSAASTNGENVTSLSEVIKNGEEDRPEDIKKANKDLVSAVKAPGKLTLSGLNFSDPEYIERVKELREKEATAEQELKDAKTRTDWARVASILGEGLTRYAAARHGLDKGVDLSNLDLKTPDWGEMLKEDEAIYGRKAQQVNRDLALEKDLSNERRKAAEALIEKANRENIAN